MSGGPWNKLSILADFKKKVFGKAYKQKFGKIMETRNNLAIFKENDKRIWRCMNKMTRILQDLDVLGAF